jgi:hypothetical protein
MACDMTHDCVPQICSTLASSTRCRRCLATVSSRGLHAPSLNPLLARVRAHTLRQEPRAGWLTQLAVRADPRIVLATFIGYSRDDEEVMVWA